MAADFALQPDALIKAKRKVWGIVIHACIFALAMAITMRDYLDSRSILIALLSLAVFHFAVDLGKKKLQQLMGRESLWLLLGDQALHVASVLLVSYIFRFRVITDQSAFAPLSLAIIAVWAGVIIFETAKAEITGSYLKPFSTLGSQRGNLTLVESGVLFAIGLQTGWFLLGLLVLIPRIVGWFKGKKVGVIPYCWAFAFILGIISRFMVLKG